MVQGSNTTAQTVKPIGAHGSLNNTVKFYDIGGGGKPFMQGKSIKKKDEYYKVLTAFRNIAIKQIKTFKKCKFSSTNLHTQGSKW